MDPLLIGLVIVAVLAAGAVLLATSRKREGERLKDRFGPEYEREVRESGGSAAKAQAHLLKREKRVEKLHIRPLEPAERAAYADQWKEVQVRFVDDPSRSIAFADALVADVMKARGYPVENFEQRAADISVVNPRVVENYRAAHQIARLHADGKANTEDLRHAVIGYRALFEELLREDAAEMAH